MAQVDTLGPWRPGEWGRCLVPLICSWHLSWSSHTMFALPLRGSSPFAYLLLSPPSWAVVYGSSTGTYVALGKLIGLPGSQASHL